MLEVTKDLLLGSAIQLIKDIERISFLGDQRTCVKIGSVTKEWLKQLDRPNCGARMDLEDSDG